MSRPQRKKPPAEPLTAFSRIGNLGCIRFPKPLRLTSGIKRGDRLLIQVGGPGAIYLEKIEVLPREPIPEGIAESVSVEACACESPPESCRSTPLEIANVGWSYVQLSAALATRLGFLPNTPIKLVAEPALITVTLHPDENDFVGIGPVACPP